MTDSYCRSATTQALVDLLARWPRAHISRAISESCDPQGALLSGELARRLPAAHARRREPCASQDKAALGLFDEAFPHLLEHIPDPPLVLYFEGDPALLADPAIAVVGARRCTSQGRENAFALGRDLARAGVHVASGLALGIDGAAHRGALQAGGPGRTIAVLGAGLGCLYPAKHAGLAREIVASGGLLLSEYTAMTEPRRHQFPERNRLISGLSLATVVVEASVRSGSLITARFAAEQGRDVLAMPGPVQSEVSAGCHRLIQQGAGLIADVEDVLSNAGLEPELLQAVQTQPETCVPAELQVQAEQVMACLRGYAVSLDELAAETMLEIGQLTRLMVELELAGIVRQTPLGYIRTSLN